MAAVGLWAWARHRGADAHLRRALTALCALLVVQGALGEAQYRAHLPSELVWVHVTLATLTWLCVLWSVAAAGRLVPRTVGQAHERLAASEGPA
jgi:cytochrome c oxidase assembly protein subunit 15